MEIKSYKDLIVWQKSVGLVNGVYVITKQMPKSEIFGLMSQMQRSSVAIPSNIAEGFGRKGRKKSSLSFYILHMLHLWNLKHKLLFQRNSILVLTAEKLKVC